MPVNNYGAQVVWTIVQQAGFAHGAYDFASGITSHKQGSNGDHIAWIVKQHSRLPQAFRFKVSGALAQIIKNFTLRVVPWRVVLTSR